MLYSSTVLLIQGDSDNIAAKYSSAVNEALYMTMPEDSRLDVYLMHSPATLMETERVIRQVYEVARQEAAKTNRMHVYISVLLDGKDFEQNRHQNWEVVVTGDRESNNTNILGRLLPDTSDVSKLPVVIVRMNDEETTTNSKKSNSSTENENDTPEHHQLLYTSQCEHNVVAVGGTFDHLHDGHKLLLTMAGYLARERLIVGITGSELLKNKKYAKAMQSYSHRKESVESFMQYVFPALKVDCSVIRDVYGPTATEKDIDALVVSQETKSGGAAVNKFRKEEKGWHELHIYEVHLIGGDADEKLSSTDLRRLELEKSHL